MILKFDVIWAGLSQLVSLSHGLILLPFLLMYLDSELLGLWYVFLALSSLSLVIESGIQPTLQRFYSYSCAGAENIYAEGITQIDARNTGQNVDLSLRLINAAKYVYRRLALAVFFLVGVGGSIYISTIQPVNSYIAVQISWCIFMLGTVLNSYFNYLTAVLIGAGEVTFANKSTVVGKAVSIVCSIALLYLGYGLFGASLGYFIGSLTQRLVLLMYCRKSQKIHLDKQSSKNIDKELLNSFVRSFKQLSISTIGGYIILRSGVFFVTSFMGLAATASYGVTMQAIGAINAVASTPRVLLIPKITKLQLTADTLKISLYYSFLIGWSLLIFVVLGAGLFVFGYGIIELTGSSVQFVDRYTMLIALLIYMLELNHSLAALYISTTNRLPFIRSSIYSGLSILVLTLLGFLYFEMTIIDLFIIQGLVQLSFNNWYWPKMAMRQLGLNIISISLNFFVMLHGVIRGKVS